MCLRYLVFHRTFYRVYKTLRPFQAADNKAGNLDTCTICNRGNIEAVSFRPSCQECLLLVAWGGLSFYSLDLIVFCMKSALSS